MNDPIVDEIRKSREELARKFNFDIHEIFKDVRKRQVALGSRLVAPAPKSKALLGKH